MEHAAELIKTAHEKGVLAMTTIGTSQEGADEETIRQIAAVTSKVEPLKKLKSPFGLISFTFITTAPAPSSCLAFSVASSCVFPWNFFIVIYAVTIPTDCNSIFDSTSLYETTIRSLK